MHVQLPHDSISNVNSVGMIGKLNGEFASVFVSQLNTINSYESSVVGSHGLNPKATPVESNFLGPIFVTKWKRRAHDPSTKNISS